MSGKKYVRIIGIALLVTVVGLILWGTLSDFDAAESVVVNAAEATPTPSPTPIPVRVTSVTAYYEGSAVVVGDEIDLDKLKVFANFDDGSNIIVDKKDFDVPDKVIQTEGLNRLIVIYKGSTGYFYADGKVLRTLSVGLNKRRFGLFNGVCDEDLTVYAIYSDGSTEKVSDYTVVPEAFNESGEQTLGVMYKNMVDTVTVYVDEFKPVKALSVSYIGPDLVQHHKVSKEDLLVMAVYDDAFLSSERIASFTILKDSFERVGENMIEVEYLGKRGTVKVDVGQRTVKGLKAEYNGPEVEYGYNINTDDLKVTVIYNDDTEEEIKDYNIYDSAIRYIGDNPIKIYYGDFKVTVNVPGIEVAPPGFDLTSDFTIKSGGRVFNVSTALPKMLDENSITGKLVKKTKVSKAYKKLGTETGWYCAFDYQFTDGDDEAYLPVTVRITLPADMEAEYTDIYYTPNRKSVVGKTNKEIIDDNVLEVVVFKVGTYLIVYDPDAYAEEEPEPDDEDD